MIIIIIIIVIIITIIIIIIIIITNTITTIPKHSGFGQVILLMAGTNEFAWVEDVANDDATLRANRALLGPR